MPVFLLALPGGALADIVDRRVFLIGAQLWTILAAIALATLTLAHAMTAFWLLALTFMIGIGAAMAAPAWSAIVPELVPREDLAIAFELSEELLGLKMKAIREHVSQIEPMAELFGDPFLTRMMHEESFRLAEVQP